MIRARPEPHDLAARLAPVVREPSAAALLWDIDGTLAPIVNRPESAQVPAAAREPLGALAARYGLVACVSGRRAAEARRLVGVRELVYVGNHGCELLVPGEREPELHPEAAEAADAVAALVGELDAARCRQLGIRREDKGPIQALHWRGAADEAAARAELERVAERAQTRGLVPHWGRKVLEVRPTDRLDKGTAVVALLSEREQLRAALYAGDDRTDLDAFAALRSLTGSGRLTAAVCVGVASSEGPAAIREDADVVVQGTEGVLVLLRELAG